MNKITKVIITFIISVIIAFLLVGYVSNAMFVSIDWVGKVTIWQKFRQYYIRTFFSNIIPAFIIAIISTIIISLAYKKRS